MVGQERQHPALIWRQGVDLLAGKGGSPYNYWELIRDTDSDDFFFAVQYATVYKVGNRKWELRYFAGGTEVITYHRTLYEAKAVGTVSIRFDQAEKA